LLAVLTQHVPKMLEALFAYNLFRLLAQSSFQRGEKNKED